MICVDRLRVKFDSCHEIALILATLLHAGIGKVEVDDGLSDIRVNLVRILNIVYERDKDIPEIARIWKEVEPDHRSTIPPTPKP